LILDVYVEHLDAVFNASFEKFDHFVHVVGNTEHFFLVDVHWAEQTEVREVKFWPEQVLHGNRWIQLKVLYLLDNVC
jgi:hypothetical protein